MKYVKRFILLLMLMCFEQNLSFGQDGIDTAIFKFYKVKKMWVWVKLPILPNKSLNDSCKAEIYEFDTLQRITYQNNRMSCYGWSNSSENFNTYDSKNRIVMSKRVTDEMTTFIKYFYNEKNDPIRIVQTSPQQPDSFETLNFYTYNKKGKASEMTTLEVSGPDTTKFLVKYEYDDALNVKLILTYTFDGQLIEKKTFEITPISRKVLEFTTETKLPREKYSKGTNMYNFNAQLSRTQYSNNTWIDYIYSDDGLLAESLSYNMLGKLNAWKRYYYEFYETNR